MHEALVFLAAAVICVPIAARLGLGSVLGYLIAGAAIGPWGLAFVGDVGSTQKMPTLNPASRYARVRRFVRVLFPAPGGPVIPMRLARPTRGCSAASSVSNPGR